MGGAHDRDAALTRSIENATRDLVLMRDEILRIAESLPRRARTTRPHLESVALRLDAVVQGLSQELMLGPDVPSVRSYVRLARRALALTAAAALAVGGGVGEGAGSQAYDEIRGRSDACEVALALVERDASELEQQAVGTSRADDAGSGGPGAETGEGFSGKAAAEIVGITYRQLDYWARTDLVRPELAAASPGGSRRRYSYRNLLELKLIKTLLDAGIKLESVRASFDHLRSLDLDLSSARLIIAGNSIVVAQDDGEMIEIVNGLHGQGVLNLNLVTLDGLRSDLDAAMFENDPPSDGA